MLAAPGTESGLIAIGAGERASADASGTRVLARALTLGLMHGPAELLPISSSGHVALVPWLLGWEQERSEPELEKAFEVALHAGTAAALLFALREEVRQAVRDAPAHAAALAALSVIPPAVVGLALERPIERRLGHPGSIAAGLIAGGVLLAWADRSPRQREHGDAGARDALALGLAQACALVPGVSRNGATLAVARLRRFRRADAERLSRHAALPVIVGATSLKCLRIAQRGLPAGSAAPFAVGVAASFGSTLASRRLIATLERDAPLLPYALYRLAIGTLVLARLRSERRENDPPQ